MIKIKEIKIQFIEIELPIDSSRKYDVGNPFKVFIDGVEVEDLKRFAIELHEGFSSLDNCSYVLEKKIPQYIQSKNKS